MAANASDELDVGAHLSGLVMLHVMGFDTAGVPHGEVGTCPAGGTPGSRCKFDNRFVGSEQGPELQGTWDVAADGRYQLMAGVDRRGSRLHGRAPLAKGRAPSIRAKGPPCTEMPRFAAVVERFEAT